MADRCFDHRTRCCQRCDPPPREKEEPMTEAEFLGNKVLDVADFAILWGVAPR